MLGYVSRMSKTVKVEFSTSWPRLVVWAVTIRDSHKERLLEGARPLLTRLEPDLIHLIYFTLLAQCPGL